LLAKEWDAVSYFFMEKYLLSTFHRTSKGEAGGEKALVNFRGFIHLPRPYG
jgi:hypothetical protein